MKFKIILLNLLLISASCTSDGWSIDSVQVMDDGINKKVLVSLPTDLQNEVRAAGDVLYLELLKCGTTIPFAVSAPKAPQEIRGASVARGHTYELPMEAYKARNQPLCARLKRTGFGFNGSRSTIFKIPVGIKVELR